MSDYPFERNETVYAPGALLKVRVFGLINHFGIATGYGTVIHSSRRFGRVHETDMAAFSGGRRITEIHYAHSHSGTELVARARSKKGMRYNVLTGNCEHFVNWVLTGKARSKQLGPTDPRRIMRD